MLLSRCILAVDVMFGPQIQKRVSALVGEILREYFDDGDVSEPS